MPGLPIRIEVSVRDQQAREPLTWSRNIWVRNYADLDAGMGPDASLSGITRSGKNDRATDPISGHPTCRPDSHNHFIIRFVTPRQKDLRRALALVICDFCRDFPARPDWDFQFSRSKENMIDVPNLKGNRVRGDACADYPDSNRCLPHLERRSLAGIDEVDHLSIR